MKRGEKKAGLKRLVIQIHPVFLYPFFPSQWTFHMFCYSHCNLDAFSFSFFSFPFLSLFTFFFFTDIRIRFPCFISSTTGCFIADFLYLLNLLLRYGDRIESTNTLLRPLLECFFFSLLKSDWFAVNLDRSFEIFSGFYY